MANQQIWVGAPAAPLKLKLAGSDALFILHDNGDGTYTPQFGEYDAGVPLATSFAEMNSLGAWHRAQPELLTPRGAKITLNGVNPTRVLFQEDDAASILGADEAPFALDNADTLIVNPDDDGDDTVTFAAAAGTSTSDASPSTNLSAGTDLDFMISVDGDEAELVQLTAVNCNTGSNIATEMQTKIQALGDNKATVTVAYSGGVYVITSGTKGTASAVVITDAAENNCADNLKIGVDNGGTEAEGTGDAANIAEATAEEVAAAITDKATGWAAVAVGDKVRILSDTEGIDSSLVVNASSTADTVLGITGSGYGGQGMGYETDMADDEYVAVATLNNVATASLADLGLSITERTETGFEIECETAAADEDVDVVVVGRLAT